MTSAKTSRRGDRLKQPTFPVAIYLQEAADLHHWCQQDRAALLDAGLDWHWVEVLPAAINRLRLAESHWFSQRFRRSDAQLRWDQLAAEGFSLRDQCLRTLRFVFRQNPPRRRQVRRIRGGRNPVDMMQALNDIAVFCAIPEVLQASRLEPATLERVRVLASSLRPLWARVQVDKKRGNPAKQERDQAYTALKQAVDEVRACGQYCFWNQPARYRGYGSHYLRTHRRASPPPPAEPADMAPEVDATAAAAPR